MKIAEIIEKVKSLGLPEDSYVVFGSCPLAVVGLREASDIDMYVTLDVWKKMKLGGWKELDKGECDVPLVSDVFEMHTNWGFGPPGGEAGHGYNPSLADLQATAMIIEGVPFASLAEVRKWKASYNRPKDLADIALIDKYLQK